MLIYRCSKHVVFKCLDCVSWEKSSQEGGSVSIGKLSVFVGGWLGIFSRFLEQKKPRNHALNLNDEINQIRVWGLNLKWKGWENKKVSLWTYVTYSLVVILDLCGHAHLHQKGRVLLRILSHDEFSVHPRQILGGPHEEDVPPSKGQPLLLPQLSHNKDLIISDKMCQSWWLCTERSHHQSTMINHQSSFIIYK